MPHTYLECYLHQGIRHMKEIQQYVFNKLHILHMNVWGLCVYLSKSLIHKYKLNFCHLFIHICVVSFHIIEISNDYYGYILW